MAEPKPIRPRTLQLEYRFDRLLSEKLLTPISFWCRTSASRSEHESETSVTQPRE